MKNAFAYGALFMLSPPNTKMEPPKNGGLDDNVHVQKADFLAPVERFAKFACLLGIAQKERWWLVAWRP